MAHNEGGRTERGLEHESPDGDRPAAVRRWLATYVETSKAPSVPSHLDESRTTLGEELREVSDDARSAPLTGQLLFVGGAVVAAWTLRSRLKFD